MEEDQKRNGDEIRAEAEAKTVAEAETEAFERLEEIAGPCEWDEVEFTVVTEGSKGFLGMGSAVARVEARLAHPDQRRSVIKNSAGAEEAVVNGELEESVAAANAAGDTGAELTEADFRLAELLEKVAVALGLVATVKIRETDEELVADLVGDDLGLFIGRHGSTLDAVQYLANIIVFRGLEGRKRIIIDAEDYRDRREETLRSLAERGASEVMKGKLEYEMKPMNAAERRIIHIHLQDREGMETTSEGKEPFRRVVIIRTED